MRADGTTPSSSCGAPTLLILAITSVSLSRIFLVENVGSLGMGTAAVSRDQDDLMQTPMGSVQRTRCAVLGRGERVAPSFLWRFRGGVGADAATSRDDEVAGSIPKRSWVKEVFMKKYHKYLGKRARTFLTLFQYLETHNIFNPRILETGTTRKHLAHPQFWEDGGSTILFDSYVNFYRGCPGGAKADASLVTSVDIDNRNCENCRRLVSNGTNVICSDSVIYLHEFQQPLDVLYLDSFDLDWNRPHPSAMHHLKELTAVLKNLKNGSIVIVDDNDRGEGKGRYVREFMGDIGAPVLFDEYQIGFIYRKIPSHATFSAFFRAPPRPNLGNISVKVPTWRTFRNSAVGSAPIRLDRYVARGRIPPEDWLDADAGDFRVYVRPSGVHELEVIVEASKPAGWIQQLLIEGEYPLEEWTEAGPQAPAKGGAKSA